MIDDNFRYRYTQHTTSIGPETYSISNGSQPNRETGETTGRELQKGEYIVSMLEGTHFLTRNKPAKILNWHSA